MEWHEVDTGIQEVDNNSQHCIKCHKNILQTNHDVVFKIFCDECFSMQKEDRHQNWKQETKKSFSPCEFCGYSFEHLHPMAYHPCKRGIPSCRCGRQWKDAGIFEAHRKRFKCGKMKRAANIDRPFKCAFCNKLFKVFSRLQAHLIIHSSDTPYSCNYCGQGFKAKDNLQIHVYIHTGERPYLCDVCGKCFNTPSSRKIHMRQHTGERPYVCTVCQKGYITKSCLNEHMRGHTGYKPYFCEMCDERFFYLRKFKIHMLKLHPEKLDEKQKQSARRCMITKRKEEMCSCPICNKVFKSRQLLTAHSKLHEDATYDCTICGKTFKSLNYMNRHMRQIHFRTVTNKQKVMCEFCNKEFSKTYIKTHLMYHTSQYPYFCEVCMMGFAQNSHLRVHMRSHTGERPYKCATCGKKYNASTTLSIHIKNHHPETLND